MSYMSIQEAMNKGSGEVKLHGWVYRERKSAKVAFVVLRDSTNIIQCVIKKDAVPEKVWDAAIDSPIETSLKITGEIKEDARAPTGFELAVTDMEKVGVSDTYPITKDQSTEFLLDQRHLWIRSRRLTAIMKVRSTVFGAIHKFFRERAFHEFAPPILTPNACEGGSTLFEVKYYDQKMYLTQSWQLYAEAAVFALEKLYCISPCFRAEKSKTSRHLSEFWMAEMEIAWAGLDDIGKAAEELVAFIAKEVIEKNAEELKILERDVEKLKKIKAPFPRLTYSEALKLLKEKKDLDVPWGKDLRTVEEDKLMELYETPVIVTHYPKETMAFYKPSDPNNPKEALCMDMLAPDGYGEIIGGSVRDTDLDSLKKALEKEGEKLERYEWYLDLRRYGSVPHSGFGLGVERVVAWMCGIDNIKDAIPFPRTMIRFRP
ncbi:asparagine--tRNA ligase [Candidatus Woesearchaeota archaeon CG11_big_fil_rev_8_21_14_0_20_43_8]|nr:MAG: asparagine--tRNA ligase [Candidatus Woesearchaeota archaeon CG11_big_fil_rev_8_21_14_0_20_43_8]